MNTDQNLQCTKCTSDTAIGVGYNNTAIGTGTIQVGYGYGYPWGNENFANSSSSNSLTTDESSLPSKKKESKSPYKGDSYTKKEVKDQKTGLKVHGGKIISLTYEIPDDDYPKYVREITPDIKDIVIYNGNTIKVTFVDGTYTTSTCQNGDDFDFEKGLIIALFKRVLGVNMGSQVFGKLMDYAFKKYSEVTRLRFDKIVSDNNEKAKKEKRHKKAQEKKERRLERQRSQRVKEMAEAIAFSKKLLDDGKEILLEKDTHPKKTKKK